MVRKRMWLAGVFAILVTATAWADSPLRVLIVDGQNNHQWQKTTPLLKSALEEAGCFQVDVATSPASGQDMSSFTPKFQDYQVVVSNYNGDLWPEATRKAFQRFVETGGGFVCVHAADNAFPKWDEYNRMIGLGGWGGRNESSGPYVYLDKDEKLVRDDRQGPGGSHGARHEFQVIIRDAAHPITDGMPRAWLHTDDELYDSLRGPAENMKILGTAFSNKSGRHEPMIMTIDYGQGRVMHTAMGHHEPSMQCVGFITVLQRGTEWAATGKVTLPIPEDFPTADKSSARTD
ncbi:MAG: ThuA domain-containing protein [Pirellulaceae bacterium]